MEYIGLDVHKETMSITVCEWCREVGHGVDAWKPNAARCSISCIGLRGELHVTLEEGTSAASLYDVLKPHVREYIHLWNPRRNAFLKKSSQSDKMDARKLARICCTPS